MYSLRFFSISCRLSGFASHTLGGSWASLTWSTSILYLCTRLAWLGELRPVDEDEGWLLVVVVVVVVGEAEGGYVICCRCC